MTIIGWHNLSNIRSADDTILLADTERTLQVFLHIFVEKSEKKQLTVICKKTERKAEEQLKMQITDRRLQNKTSTGI